MVALTERSVYLWTGLFLALLAITFSQQLALIYLSIIVLDYILFETYENKITINTVSGNSGQAALVGIIAYIAFMVIAIIAMTLLQFGAVQNAPVNSFFRAQWQAGLNPLNPIFQNSPLFIILSFGLLIPILETRLTGRFYNILVNSFHVDIKDLRLRNWKLWAIIIFISMAAVIFHLQAKGITDNVALGLTFLFWIAQLITMSITNEMESAIYLHMINNTLTVAKNALGLF